MAAEEIRRQMMDRHQASQLYGAEVAQGNEVFKGGGAGVIEHVIINPETRGATHTRHEHPYFTEPVHVTTGLIISGILRKTSLFSRRRFVEIDESGLSVQKGDQLQLVDGMGDEYTRMKVKKNWGAVIRSEVERLSDK